MAARTEMEKNNSSRWHYLRFKVDAPVDSYLYSLYDNDYGGKRMTVKDVAYQWLEDPDFCDFFTGVLDDNPLSAYFFEVRPFLLDETVMAQTDFEFVTVFSRPLAKAVADPAPFMAQLQDCYEYVTHFANLAGDTVLVVPCLPPRRDSYKNYTSLRSFVTDSKKGSTRHVQQRLLWQRVAQCLLGMADHNAQTKTQPKRTWVSTSGLGVSWLHVRLAHQPKYISYEPYQERQQQPKATSPLSVIRNNLSNSNLQ